jgi:predicted ATPase
MAALVDRENVDPNARRDAILATFANLAIGRTRPPDGQPVMLVIDDLERTDPGTTDSLLCMLARLQEAPVLLVGTYRSDIVMAQRATHPLTPLVSAAARVGERSAEVNLGPVDRSHMRSVAESILHGKTSLAHSFLDQLWRETEGNPLYIREIIRSLQDKRSEGGARLLLNDGEWRLTGNLQDWQTPASVEDAIRTRLDQMDPISRTELERAAVIGRRFAFSVIMHLTDSDEDALLSRLEECISTSLIQEVIGTDDESFEFTHGKIRDVLYESMSRIRRRKLHSVVSDALLALRSTMAEDWDALIGEHLYQSGRFSEALPMLRRAATKLLQVSAAKEAAGLLGKALDAHKRSSGPNDQLAELRLARVRALTSANEYGAALELAVATVSDPASDGLTRGWALDFIGDIEWAKGRRQAALAAYQAAQELALSEGQNDLELEVSADLAELHYRSSEQLAGIDDDEATASAVLFEQYLEQEVALSTCVADPTARARALRNEAKLLRRRGDVAGALAKYEEALALTDPHVATHSVLISYAKTLRFANRIDEAVEVVDRVLSWSTQSGARRSLAIALHYRAIVRFDTYGALTTVKADLDEALAIHAEIGYDRGIWEVSTLLGEWCAANGDWPEALRWFRQALKAEAVTPEFEIIQNVQLQLDAIEEPGRARRLAEAWGSRV